MKAFIFVALLALACASAPFEDIVPYEGEGGPTVDTTKLKEAIAAVNAQISRLDKAIKVTSSVGLKAEADANSVNFATKSLNDINGALKFVVGLLSKGIKDLVLAIQKVVGAGTGMATKTEPELDYIKGVIGRITEAGLSATDQATVDQATASLNGMAAELKKSCDGLDVAVQKLQTTVTSVIDNLTELVNDVISKLQKLDLLGVVGEALEFVNELIKNVATVPGIVKSAIAGVSNIVTGILTRVPAALEGVLKNLKERSQGLLTA